MNRVPEPPPVPTRRIFDLLQAFAVLIVLVQLIRSGESLPFKITVLGLLLMVGYTWLVFRLGRRRERCAIRQAMGSEARTRRRGGQQVDRAQRAGVAGGRREVA